MNQIIQVDPAMICAANARIKPHLRRTPLLEDLELNEVLGGRLLIKFEALQYGGSFKFRGAMNAILSLSTTERQNGVAAYSSGNHAVAVATAAKLLSVPAVVLMPTDVPRVKLDRTKHLGAEVVLYDRENDNRDEIIQSIVRTRGMTLVKPFDDIRVIAGQGSLGVEICEQLDEISAVPDAVAIPCSGGGLASGVGLAIKSSLPATDVVIVEPSGFEDTKRSLELGHQVSNSARKGSICDALLVPVPGDITFPILKSIGARGVSVTDEDALAGVEAILGRFKVAAEPGGAVGVAAVLTGRIPIRGKTVVAVCSGGNIDPAILKAAIGKGGAS